MIWGWPLKSVGLNCANPLIHGFFSIVNTTVLHDPQLLNPWMWNHEYTEGPHTQRADCKLQADFWQRGGSMPLTPALFKVNCNHPLEKFYWYYHLKNYANLVEKCFLSPPLICLFVVWFPLCELSVHIICPNLHFRMIIVRICVGTGGRKETNSRKKQIRMQIA